MEKTSSSFRNDYKEFKDLSNNEQDKIASQIKTSSDETLLSPTVEDYIYFTNRALDYGDFYSSIDTKSKSANKRGQWIECPNKNADYFDITQIHDIHPHKNIPRYLTFRTAGLFENHQSSDPTKSIGFVFDAYDVNEVTNDDHLHITLLSGLDKKKSPQIARDLTRYPERVGTSMGCSIKYSICTICGTEIYKEADLCEHLRGRNRNRIINGKRASELLIGPDFYEDSIVTNPAAPTAYVIDAIAKFLPGRLLKIASEDTDTMDTLYIMENIYKAIKEAKTREEKSRLSRNFDKLIHKLELMG